MTLNIYVLLYDRFAEFEIVEALLLLREQNIIFVGFKDDMYISESKLKVLTDICLNQVNPSEVDLFIIPGGEPKNLIRNIEVKENVILLNSILQTLNSQKTKIAAICGGPTFLANAGILDGKKCTGSISEDEKHFFQNSLFTELDYVMDDNILTAQGQAFTEFAVEIARWVEILKSEEDCIETLNWLRNKK